MKEAEGNAEKHLEKTAVESNLSEIKLLTKIKDLESENARLKKENEILKKNMASSVTSEVEKVLKCIFSQTQIRAILDNKVVKQWSDEDIAAAFTMRSISAKFYEYLRTVKGIPLPSRSTLNARAKNFPCEPGILKSVLALMKAKSDTMTEMEKVAVMSFDEMAIVSEWNYDKGSDTLYKPHKRVLVFMVRGLVGRWKQPIYYDFDVSYSKDVLFNLIRQIEEAGYPVVAIVHDMGPTNLRIWKDFNIDPMQGKCSFKNPDSDREVFILADVPHIMKLIRNNFIDSGFILHTGERVSDCAIREMMSMQKTELSLAHRINEIHLNVQGQQRQRVKYATQLLSESCSKALLFLGERGFLKSCNFKETADFLALVDKWFDVMNSSQKFGDKLSRNAFGINLDEQRKTLQNMMYITRTMKVDNSRRKGLYQFQKGILLSSFSLIGLSQMLSQVFGISYIMTRKLNQDCLEHFFGCIRQMEGTYEHPNCITFKHRLKKLLLGKEAKLLAPKTCCNEEEFEPFASVRFYAGKGNSNEDLSYDQSALSQELCLTAMIFKDIELDENEVEEYQDEKDSTLLSDVNTPQNVMEEESLMYIGGYIVKKYIHKYPHLGNKAINREANSLQPSWIDVKNRGGLYFPSDYFMLDLKVMRNKFKAMHGSGLIAGKRCVQNIVEELKTSVQNVPQDVIVFFAKISVYFRMRQLNRNLRMERKKANICRNEDRKRKKKLCK